MNETIREFLAKHGPSTSTEVAIGIGRGLTFVTNALQDFPTAPAPLGRSGRATFYTTPRVLSPAFSANDTDYLEAALADGGWHRMDEIIQKSQRERGHGLTVHSRAADLRKRGYTVEQRSERMNGRVISFYRSLGAATPSNPRHPSASHAGTDRAMHRTTLDGGVAAQNDLIPRPGATQQETTVVPGQLHIGDAA